MDSRKGPTGFLRQPPTLQMHVSDFSSKNLWLSAWQVDFHSKAVVTAYSFQGDRLFGDYLDKILLESRDK